MTTSYSAGDSKRIIIGAAAVFIADDNTVVLPDLTTSVSSAEDLFTNAAGWRNVGYTDGGIEVSYEPTYTDVTVDQMLDSAVVFKSGMKVLVNTTFGEATLENLLVSWGGEAGDLTDGNTSLDISAGHLGDFPVERAVAFVGPGPRTVSTNQKNERIYNVGRAIQTQTTAHKLARDSATTLPVSFRCLPDSTTNSYGKVVDRAYAIS